MSKYSQVKIAIYKLKRLFGQSIVLTNLGTQTTDYTSGVTSSGSDTTKTIKRAILMPEKTIRTFTYDLAFIAANKNFTVGGLYDKSQRLIIIDLNDVVGFTVSIDTRVTFGGNDYNIKEINEYEESSSLTMIVVKVKGQR